MSQSDDETSRMDFGKSCFTTILIFITIVLTVFGLALHIDYMLLGALWFFALVLLYSLDQFILRKIWWPRHSRQRREKLLDELLNDSARK